MKLNKNVVKFSAAVAGAVALGTVAVATNASADEIYTVQSGDTLSAISYKYSNDLSMVDTLATKNSIANKDLIYVGQKLIIKDDGEVRQATQQEVQTTPAASATSSAASTATTTSSAASTSTPASSSAATSTASATSASQSTAAQSTTSSAAQSSATSATTQRSTSTTSSSSYTSSASGSEDAAKAWIANRESGGSYTVTNGQYIGKYQLSSSYLNGDYSAANQEKVADAYVASRYGSWTAAMAHEQATGWY